MKRTVLVFIGFVAALSLLWSGFAIASNVRSGESPRVMADEVIDGALYTVGKDIKVDGRVEGDIMCAGQTVEITGTVEGDVLCAAQTITVSGHVEGDVRAAGQVVVLKGKIDGSASIAAQNSSIETGAVVGRDVTIVSQLATIDGTVARDAQVTATTFSGDAVIGRNLDLTAQVITLHDKTNIAGDFRYISEPDAAIAMGAHITGKTEHSIPDTRSRQMVTPATYVNTAIFSFLSLLLVGAALLLAVPRLVAATTATLQQRPFVTVAVGCGALVVAPFIAVMLMVTIIGIPLGLLLLFSWLVSLFVAVALSAHAVGHMIIKKLGWQDAWRHFASMVIGLFAIFLGSLLPFIGGFIIFCALVWGVGAQWYTLIKRRGHEPAGEKTEAKK